MTDEFLTLAAEFRHEIERIKGSRFVTTAFPASSPDEALERVERIRAELSGASHHPWAYRIGPGGESFRSSDGGEPGGSAGRPILQQIEGHGLTNACVVVTRWFGGTKLGVGGLMRAYGGAAGRTLDRAPLRTAVITCRVEIEYPYECSGPIDGLLAAHGIEPVSADYGASVQLVLDVPRRNLGELERELLDRSAGRARVSGPKD